LDSGPKRPGPTTQVGDIDAIEEEPRLQRAAEKGMAAPFIDEWPQKYRTQLGDAALWDVWDGRILRDHGIPSGKPTKNDGTSPFLVGKFHYKLPCSIANWYKLLNYQRVWCLIIIME